jgi:hypothetical protein
MKSGHIFLVLLFIIPLCWGCSKSNTNPIAGSFLDEPAMISSSELDSSIGLFGAYNLTIAPDGRNVELTPMRLSSIGESYIVSGLNFFTVCPCPDCLNLFSFEFEPPYVKVTFDISHPFKPGNTSEPPTAMNRLDLDVFDLAMVIVPTQAVADTYSIGHAYTNVCGNQHGYTTELNSISGDSAACPYFLVIDNSETGSSTYNEFAMGTKNVLFDTWFANIGRFDLYLTMGYGFSARRPQRLQPEYFNPEFNRKAAWRVDVIPPEGDDPPAVGNTWDSKDMITEYDVTVEVYDWQIGANVNSSLSHSTDVYSASEVEKVSVEIPGMTSLPAEITSETGGTGMPNDPLLFTVPIANENGIPQGEYTGLVKVLDERIPPDTVGARDFLIHSASADYPEDITPSELSFYSDDIFIDGNLAYIADYYKGLHIFDISDIENPDLIITVVPPDAIYSHGVYVDNGYAYLGNAHTFIIIDVNPPSSAHIVKEIEVKSKEVHVQAGYAYTVGHGQDLSIIDIEPPEDAHVVNIVDCGTWVEDVFVDGDYAYVADYHGLEIININPPESAYIVNTINMADIATGVAVLNDYAYVANRDTGMKIININPPETAYVARTVNTSGSAYDVCIDGDYAYVADNQSGLAVIDINPPSSASVISSLDTTGYAECICTSGGNVFIGGENSGMTIIDVSTPVSPSLVKIQGYIGRPKQVSISGNYAYVSSDASSVYENSFHILNIESPSEAYAVKSFTVPFCGGVDSSGGYAYVGTNDSLTIFDVDPPESASEVNSVPYTGFVADMKISGDYAFLCGTHGLTVVDIDPPGSAYEISRTLTGSTANSIDVSGNYAYLSVNEYGLQIFNISNPASPELVRTLYIPEITSNISVSGKYAYLEGGTNENPDLVIVDITPPESAHIVRTLDVPYSGGSLKDVFVDECGYVYLSTNNSITICNVKNPLNPCIDYKMYGLGNTYGIDVSQNYVFVCDHDYGLKILTRYFTGEGDLLFSTMPEYATYQTFKATVVEGL